MVMMLLGRTVNLPADVPLGVERLVREAYGREYGFRVAEGYEGPRGMRRNLSDWTLSDASVARGKVALVLRAVRALRGVKEPAEYVLATYWMLVQQARDDARARRPMRGPEVRVARRSAR